MLLDPLLSSLRHFFFRLVTLSFAPRDSLSAYGAFLYSPQSPSRFPPSPEMLATNPQDSAIEEGSEGFSRMSRIWKSYQMEIYSGRCTWNDLNEVR